MRAELASFGSTPIALPAAGNGGLPAGLASSALFPAGCAGYNRRTVMGANVYVRNLQGQGLTGGSTARLDSRVDSAGSIAPTPNGAPSLSR